MLRAVSYLPPDRSGATFDLVLLAHDERRIRRKLLTMSHGDEVMVDLPQPVTLEHGGALVLEDGRQVEVIAAEEDLYEVRGTSPTHLMRLCWHLGNRHAPAQIEDEGDTPARILILRDHVLRDMLVGLGAAVTEVSEPFHPQHGAYHGHGHGHHHHD